METKIESKPVNSLSYAAAVCCEPLDFFDDAVVPVMDWINRDKGSAEDYRNKWSLFLRAAHAYAICGDVDFEMRDCPVVAYDVGSDSEYFIFKQDNNGTTIVVFFDRIPAGLEDKVNGFAQLGVVVWREFLSGSRDGRGLSVMSGKLSGLGDLTALIRRLSSCPGELPRA